MATHQLSQTSKELTVANNVLNICRKTFYLMIRDNNYELFVITVRNYKNRFLLHLLNKSAFSRLPST